MIKDSNDKWYDEKFVHHTLSGLDCFPVYMQASIFVLEGKLRIADITGHRRGQYDRSLQISQWKLPQCPDRSSLLVAITRGIRM